MAGVWTNPAFAADASKPVLADGSTIGSYLAPVNDLFDRNMSVSTQRKNVRALLQSNNARAKFVVRQAFFPYAAFILFLSILPAQARSPMPDGLPITIDRAVGICLDLISGQAPRQRGQFKKTRTGFSRAFAEKSNGVLESSFQLNGSKEPRVEILIKRDRVCSIFVVRLGGGYKQHFSQVRAAFERRGWDYKRKGIATLSKGDRLMSTKGGTSMRDRSGDVMTNFSLIEWMRDGKKSLKRRY